MRALKSRPALVRAATGRLMYGEAVDTVVEIKRLPEISPR
jgi:hypothetical protein